jgi:hypothetical protein
VRQAGLVDIVGGPRFFVAPSHARKTFGPRTGHDRQNDADSRRRLQDGSHTPQVFPSAACITALVDRFAQHCHTMDIDADTWRPRPRGADAPSTPRSKKKSRRR